jgi:protein-S-isoprenylcysteine O-methyltransferase Ste14
MTLTFVALRTALYATGFLWLWAWIAQLLRPFDDLLGGSLPVWSRAPGLFALAVGGVVIAWCLCAFVVRGRGTPALFDAPTRLVAWGPYRYTRNPMYSGAALLLLGFGLYQRSPSIVLFVPAWWLLFHLLVVFYEEVTLRGKFGPDYDAYYRTTPRWIPRFTRPAPAVLSPAGPTVDRL